MSSTLLINTEIGVATLASRRMISTSRTALAINAISDSTVIVSEPNKHIFEFSGRFLHVQSTNPIKIKITQLGVFENIIEFNSSFYTWSGNTNGQKWQIALIFVKLIEEPGEFYTEELTDQTNVRLITA